VPGNIKKGDLFPGFTYRQKTPGRISTYSTGPALVIMMSVPCGVAVIPNWPDPVRDFSNRV
jgi:hypothetical protein